MATNHFSKSMTVEEVAKYLQVGKRTVYRYIRSRKLKATKIGGWRIAIKDLQDFIKRSSNIQK